MKIISMYPHPFDMQYRHDHNCTIISNGDIYSYEEAKLRGTKNDEATIFPLRSLLFGLKELNITPKDIDLWIFPKPYYLNKIYSYKFFFCDFLKLCSVDDLAITLKKIRYVPHHLAHAYTAIHTSPFYEEPNLDILSCDGGGDLGNNKNIFFILKKSL